MENENDDAWSKRRKREKKKLNYPKYISPIYVNRSYESVIVSIIIKITI